MTGVRGRPSLLDLPDGVRLEHLGTGAGTPVTLFVPGLGGTVPDVRPLGSGVRGTRVFLQLRGHGRSSAPDPPWRYADLAADLAAAADALGAQQALGVSLGAAALSRLVVDEPRRFGRLVFFLPAVLDAPRTAPAQDRLRALSAAVAAGARDEVARLVSLEVPGRLRHDRQALDLIRRRTGTLLGGKLRDALPGLLDDVPVTDAAALGRVDVPALVIGCRGDELHPADVAERLAAALPAATLHVYDEPGVLWTQRADLRARVGGFLSGGG